MSAIQQLLTEHIDIWTAAETEKKLKRGRASGSAASVYGIKKLRELILELAVRGKLVQQDGNDEPSSQLLKKIKIELGYRNSKVRSKSIEKLPYENVIDPPFSLPASWTWVYLPAIAGYKVGKTPSTKNSEFWSNDIDGYNWVSIADLNHDGLIVGTGKKITEKAKNEIFRQEPAPAGTILMSFKLTLGKISILDFPAYHNEAIISLYPEKGISDRFLFKVLPARALAGNSKSAIMGNTLNSESLAALMIPLPPLAEQLRIVAKVDELMALCDQLEAQHSNNADAHEQLVNHLLGTLTHSQNAEDFNTNWQRIAAHFDTLFTTEASIDALKQTLLQLAVMGKLVAQDANDESASELLKRIRAEKAQLISQGKIKKDKIFAKISKKDMAFELPQTWEWARIGELALSTDYGLSEQTFDTLNGIPVLKMGDIQNGKITLGGQKKVEADTEGLPDLFLKPGDLLYNRTNSPELVGKTGIFQGEDAEYTFASYLIRIRCFSALFSPSYLNFAMNAPLFRKTQIDPHLKQQCGQANVNGTIMKNMIVSFPGLAEQRRICAKVEELMAMCDQLKSHISNVNQYKKNIADVLVEHAVDG